MIPFNDSAYKLMHEGAIALADVESNGMRVDVGYFKKQQKRMNLQITKVKEQIMESDEGKLWRKRYGNSMNFDSNDQLATVLFVDAGYEAVDKTASGERFSTSQAALEKVESPIVPLIFRMRKLAKAQGTYIKNIVQEEVDGLVHPFFNLHTVRTYRSSCDTPNFQNIPIRDSEIGEIIRTGFIPRDGHTIIEVDYSGIEVRFAACYHHDPNMISYIKDPAKDMHRDMAAQCFKLSPGEVSKKIRYCGKNMFVFPQFYGDYYANCARSMWDATDRMNLQLEDGTILREHLKASGMTSYKRFEKHVLEVEKDFWRRRFKHYGQWKDDWYDEYLVKGYFNTLTGFRCQGVMGKNDVINYPVQGSAFHCLLWSLTRMNEWLQQNKMETKIICQIHDSMVLDVHPAERDMVLMKLNSIMTKRIRKVWDWIIVPLDIEAEETPVDGSWFQKKEIEI